MGVCNSNQQGRNFVDSDSEEDVEFYYDPFNYQCSYTDDQPLQKICIPGQTHLQDFDYNDDLNIQIKPQVQGIKVGKRNVEQLPVVVSIKARDRNNHHFDRLPVDLICVLDHSGSMAGEKMKLLTKTMLHLLNVLHKDDRLCIVEFDHRGLKLSPLLRCTRKNKRKLKQIINAFEAKGGTDISKGMREAFYTIKNRQYKNPITGVFLLSDGLDNGAELKVANILKEMKIQDNFTIDTFGYGHEHCPKLMVDIARQQHGNFYFIEELHQVDEFLVDAVCSLMSAVAEQVELRIEVIEQTQGVNTQIGKTYGDMWNYDYPQQQHVIKMNNMMSGMSKDFVKELHTQPMDNQQFLDINPSQTTKIKVQFKAKVPGTNQDIYKEQILELHPFFESDLQYQELQNDPEVMAQFHRVRAAEAMEQGLLAAENGNHDEAIDLLHEILIEIRSCNKHDKKQLKVLMKDLELCKEVLQPKHFHRKGRHHLIAKIRSHIEQRSHGNGVDCVYSNNLQKEMVQQVQKKKW